MNNTKSTTSLFPEPSRTFEIFGSIIHLFVGAFFLWTGINSVVRVLTRVENPYAFEWFTVVCVLFFTLSFFCGIVRQTLYCQWSEKTWNSHYIWAVVFYNDHVFHPILILIIYPA